MTQPALAEVAGMSQPRISEIERPGERKLNLETLLRLASAFDVALQVRFVPFTNFVEDNDSVDYDDFKIPSFEEDMSNLASVEEQRTHVLRFDGWVSDALVGAGQHSGMGASCAASGGISSQLQKRKETVNEYAVNTKGAESNAA